ncbi:aspartyl-tRNA synthetase 2, mitochondrial [Dinochytrium kinnereticum]|nr:aspartyl-tRNA synthetase 2, mitochondrial [Dinochytrium kinnereticum]
MQKYSRLLRSHLCGELGTSHVGQNVCVSGWALKARKIGENKAFVPLKDHSGTVQLVVDAVGSEKIDEIRRTLLKLNPESVITVSGKVRSRPEGAVQKNSPSGAIELEVLSCEILNECETMPFSLLSDKKWPNEEVLLQHRFISMRNTQLQDNLRKRSQASQAVRSLLTSNGFVEVETPYLFKSTPEGSREFLVPTRKAGHFFALPQSPQQFKQVLMAGGIDKYFQFARCFRDESLGSDRQPEFTQIDLEMAFVEANDVKSITEKIVATIWKVTTGEEVQFPFQTMGYYDAMKTYGSDKPDTRFGMVISNLSSAIPNVSKEANMDLDALVIPNGVKLLSSSDIKGIKSSIFTETFPLYGGKILPSDLDFVPFKQTDLNTWIAGIPLLRGATSEQLQTALNLKSGDMLVLNRRKAGYFGGSTALGRTRLLIAALLRKKGSLEMSSQNKFLWIEDFPLFSPSSDDSAILESTHHPFTAPVEEDIHIMLNNPLKSRAQHYDLVLNGQEIGGGSIRVHNPKMQNYIMQSILGLSSSRIERDFGHLLKALSYGCPPHGGLALGLDRIMAIVCGAESIRDVIAFPKLSGGDLFTNSPGKVPSATLSEYKIKVEE